MKITNNIILLGIGILIFMMLKMAYTFLSTEQLLFVLAPTNFLVSLMLGTKSAYVHGYGYFYHDLNITIEKACSGYNFMLLSFTMMYYLGAKYFKNRWSIWFILSVSTIFSWALTLFVNTSRIVSSVIINKSLFSAKSYNSVFHQVEGTFIYLFFLVLMYKILDQLLKKHAKNEKFA
ncbi:exosortase K [Pedobacter chinensis]|uniref:Exosortase K n=1 Tax=Pedobacter chinensis TaxID=2282421 RepID=A0A369Q4U3_9SPHI|nr:exosortase K [Pedobacter chinensis]RDC58297.1 exosortase K [Pedobacter chinensis]